MKMNRYAFDQNSFDLIRYYAAFAVMCLHFTSYFYLTRISPTQTELQAADIIRKIAVATPPVVILFCLSGFFAMASLSHNSSAGGYIKKRIYRLYPSIWFCTIINLIAIFFISKDLVNMKQILVWLLTQIFGIANTPAFFKNIATGSVNGALWTIVVQFQIYLFFSVLYRFISKLHTLGWSIMITSSIVANILCRLVTDAIGNEKLICKLIERSFVPYIIFALIGASVFRFFDRIIPVLTKGLPVFLVIIFMISHNKLPDYGYYCGVITAICTSLLFLGIGYCFKLRLSYDISYELFLYHWIVLNFVVHYDLINRISFGLGLVVFFILSIILAIICKYCLSLICKVLFSHQIEVRETR